MHNLLLNRNLFGPPLTVHDPVFHPVSVVRQALVLDGERNLSARPIPMIG